MEHLISTNYIISNVSLNTARRTQLRPEDRQLIVCDAFCIHALVLLHYFW